MREGYNNNIFNFDKQKYYVAYDLISFLVLKMKQGPYG